MGTVFSDPAVEPTPALIEDALGPAFPAWVVLTKSLESDGVSVGWRHYRDGGWLAKAVVRAKTVAWLQVDEGFARATFYFPERLRDTLAAEPELTEGLRERIARQAPTGRSLGVTIEVRGDRDVADAVVVLGLKRQLT